MENHKPPFRISVPGKVYRNEATDATHEAQFVQLEGLFVDKNISLSHLKGTMNLFFKKLIGKDTKTRFRPSFFPFIEPGVEVDATCSNARAQVARCAKEPAGWRWEERVWSIRTF